MESKCEWNTVLPLESTVWIFSETFSFKMLILSGRTRESALGTRTACLRTVGRGKRRVTVCTPSSCREILLGHIPGYGLANPVASLVPLPAYDKCQRIQRRNGAWGAVSHWPPSPQPPGSSELHLDQRRRATVMPNACSQGGCGKPLFKSAEREVRGGRRRKRETVDYEKSRDIGEGKKESNDEKEDDQDVVKS